MSELIQVSLPHGAGTHDVHVRACVDGAGGGADLAHADVLYFTQRITPAQVAAQLEIYPGCVVCAGAVENGTLVFAVRGEQRHGDAPFVASAVHALLTLHVGTGERA